jgi:L,D-transpeptidase catalytic domain
MSGRVAIFGVVAALAAAVAVCPAHAAEAAPQAQAPAIAVPASSPTVAPGWAPQPGTRAYQDAHPAPASQAQATPAATPGGGYAAGALDGWSDRKELHHGFELTPGMRAYEMTRDSSYLNPLNWAVMVYKSRHELLVYYKGRIYQHYDAVFGRSLDHGTKLWEGDRRTPEGVYTIVEKHPSLRWRWFLTLNYPNLLDRRRYDELLQGRVLPVRGGHPVAEGGHIGIHGTDNPLLNRGDVNWTTGCISVSNRDVSELRRILPIGTVVIIKP